ncbi:alpha/beta hydrolase family protein [Cellulomonas shaoxiangyii]|uniref:Alpha/beta hydrolase n=1 Tax=Cellulomonas shaoxiangyii TaxID=2566013 RepID=A0A4P7SGX0_9CELL|nr:acyl-CoA thioester hydrolase/BAAT C-terminal domain-containing protein [Cellulomonas shaoxiangyii]QCB93252.1 alpha/beta hydrolase [Cellulomonas shaoxiangyii]TGY80756.1 alpha/beta hydrolase [Cellulomonas shaoxiangyii]
MGVSDSGALRRVRRAVRRSTTSTGRLSSAYRLVASVALGSVLLAIVGAALGPSWSPAAMTETIRVTSTSTAIGGAPELGRYEVRTEVVEIALDGVTVQGRLSVPVGAEEPVPGVVFVHGAGTGRFTKAFLAQAHALAASGVAALVPDKRLDTYTARHREYVAMADDYARSVALMRERPEVDAARVGVYAESEGGWIAPVMAAQDPDLAFVVLVSAPVVPPRQQAAFATDAYLRNTQVPHGVFRAIPRAVGMSMPGGGFEYVDFDVRPYQQRMRQPLLVVYGTGDVSMPIVQGAVQIRSDAAVAGNDAVTVRYYDGASHGIRVDGEVSPAFLEDLPGWVLGLPATADAEPRAAGAQPTQPYLAAPVPEPGWLRDGTVMIALVVIALAALVLAGLAVVASHGAHGAASLVRRTGRRAAPPAGDGRDAPDPGREPEAAGDAVEAVGTRNRYAPGVALRLVVLAVTTTLTVAAMAWYLLSVARLALDYERNSWVVQGGWLVVRLLGVAAVVAAVALARRSTAVREADVPVAPGVVRGVALWTVVVGCAVLLVVLAYWGVFQLGI